MMKYSLKHGLKIYRYIAGVFSTIIVLCQCVLLSLFGRCILIESNIPMLSLEIIALGFTVILQLMPIKNDKLKEVESS